MHHAKTGSSTRRALLGLVALLGGCARASATKEPVDAAAPVVDAAGTSGADLRAPSEPTDGGVSAACAGRYDFAAVTTAVAAAVSDQVVPGISFGGYTVSCGPIVLQAAGTLTTDAVVELASGSKIPAATAIMTLVHDGRLQLDDRVSRYLDYWPDDKASITLRMLLSHTSGLPANTSCLGDATTTLDACARAIAALTLAGTPGTVFIYGGADYQVAGRVAEVVSGQSWNDFFAAALTQPCALTTLSYLPSTANSLGSASNPRIAGGAASDNEDYGRLLALHLAGGRCGAQQLLTPAETAQLQQDQFAVLQAQLGAAPTIVSSPFSDGRHYGLGWWLEPASAAVFSDEGAYGALPWIDTARGYGGFILIKKVGNGVDTGQQLFHQLAPLMATQIDAHGV